MPASAARSTPRSRASLRTGGLASTVAGRPPPFATGFAAAETSSARTPRPGRCLARPPGRRAELDPVANQHGLAFLRGRRRGGLVRARRWQRRDEVVRGRAWPFGRDGRRIHRRAGRPFAGHVDRDDRGAHVHRLALGDQQVSHHALERAGQLDDRLGRLDVHDDLVDLHAVAGLDPPADDVRLGQPLAHIGQPELASLCHLRSPQAANVRSTVSSTRSRSGR